MTNRKCGIDATSMRGGRARHSVDLKGNDKVLSHKLGEKRKLLIIHYILHIMHVLLHMLNV